MKDYSKYQRSGEHCHSLPFHTAPGGYKLQLQLDAAGSGRGASTISVQVMKGEDDDCLRWPFGGSVDIKVLNWREDENHLEHTFTASTIGDPTLSLDRVTGSATRSNNESQRSLLIPHKQLDYNSDYNTQYLMNDFLCVEITGVTIPPGMCYHDPKKNVLVCMYYWNCSLLN